jgi:diguanylate cyclase (GGDEF)-like protein/PAS domain S-box-containing protein
MVLNDLSLTLFDYNLDAILITNPDGTILAANPAACHTFACLEEELVSKGISNLISPDDVCLGAGQKEQAWFTFYKGEITFKRKDGSAFSANVASVVNPSAEGEPKMVLFIRDITSLHSALREQATRDPLTGLFNRRYLDEALQNELVRARREGSDVSLIMIDIDNFKEINDLFGHSGGDQVLQRLAQYLKENTRRTDVACRYGGDEFMILLPEAPAGTAFQRAEALSHNFESEKTIYSGMKIPCTLSIGIAQYPLHGNTGLELLTAVDNAMYDAKDLGKNRVVIWKDDSAQMSQAIH